MHRVSENTRVVHLAGKIVTRILAVNIYWRTENEEILYSDMPGDVHTDELEYLR